MSRRISLVAALALSLPAAAAPAAKQVTSVEGITEYSLPNGLRVLLFPDPTKQTITVNITYLVGSRHEGYGETGMAHLLEHMVFKGTPRHKNIPQELTSHGARPNGTTSFDRTNYFETFEANDKNLEWALDLEADRMVHSFVKKSDLDTEMTVVRNEFESGENSPGGVLIKRMLDVMFDWHNYAHLPIGARSDIENVPIERLQAFYHRYYQPDNAVLTIAGRFDEKAMLRKVVKHFAQIARPKRQLIPTYTREPVQDGERSVTLKRVGDVQLVEAAFHVPSGTHPDAAALQILSFVLGDTPAGRLHKALVETQKATSAFASFFSLREPGVFLAGAEVRKEQSLADARKGLLDTLAALKEKPIEASEVERARTAYLKNFQLTLNQSERVGLQLSEYIAQGDWRLFFLRRDRLKKVTPEDVQRVALQYLRETNRTMGEFLPTVDPDKERAEVPEAAPVAQQLEGYKGEAPMAQGEAFDPSPANIESRTARSEQAGLKIALLPKKTRGGTVHVGLTLHYGALESLKGKTAVSDLALDMLMRGTQKHTRQELHDALDKLKARLSVGGGGGNLVARIETVRESLPAALALLREVLREPSFPAAQLEELRQENLASIDQQRSDPGSLATLALQNHESPYPADDPRHAQSPDEATADYRAATLEQVKAFYAQYIGGAQGELSIVGDFDDKAMADQLASLVADWRAPEAYQRIPHPYQAVDATTLQIEAPDKANAVLLAGQNLELRDDDADYPALIMANYMLGGGFLNSRMAVRIRQKEGLSYGVNTSLSAGAIDKRGSFGFWAIHAPKNTEALEKAMREELDRARADGFSATELNEARAGWLQSRQVQRSNDGGLSALLASHLYLGRTLKWDADLEDRVRALTAEQVSEAFRKWVDPQKLTVVRAGDFKKAKLSTK